jgi:ketosteroid isomerase-like protein
MKTLEQRVQIIEDREAIAALQARYINLNDGGWDGPTHCFPEAVGELFVEDGVWAGPETAGRAQGRAAIVALFHEFAAVPFIVHYVTNPLIEIDGDTATGQWHAIIASTMPGGDALWTLGRYDNQYVRTADGWKYRTLNFLSMANSPYELGWGKQQFVGREMSFR